MKSVSALGGARTHISLIEIQVADSELADESEIILDFGLRNLDLGFNPKSAIQNPKSPAPTDGFEPP